MGIVYACKSDAECQSVDSYTRKRPWHLIMVSWPPHHGYLDWRILCWRWGRVGAILSCEFKGGLQHLWFIYHPLEGNSTTTPLWQSKMSPNIDKYTPRGEIIPIEKHCPISNDWWIHAYLYIFINVKYLRNSFLMIFGITKFFD